MILKIKRLLLLQLMLVCIAYSTRTLAQKQGQARIDSLTAELPRAAEDTNKVKLLNSLSAALATVKPEEGIKQGELAKQLATRLNWTYGSATACLNIGSGYKGKSDPHKALEYYEKALQLYEAAGSKSGIATTTGNIGSAYRQLGDDAKALDYLLKALKLHEEAGNKNGVATTTTTIGNVYLTKKDLDKALEYYRRALKMHEEAGNKDGMATTSMNIGNAYARQNNPSKALEYFTQALKINESVGNKIAASMIASNIGTFYEEQKNYTMAMEYYRTSLAVATEIGNKSQMAHCLRNMGCMYLFLIDDLDAAGREKTVGGEHVPAINASGKDIPQGKPALLKKAVDYLEQALPIAKESGEAQHIMETYEGLVQAYDLSGKYKAALDAMDNFHKIKDSVFSSQNNEQIVKLGVKYDYERQRMADSMKTVEKERIATVQLQKQRGYTYAGIAGVLLLAGFSFFIAKERGKSERERKKSDDLLLNILPGEVADELKLNGVSKAKHFDNVTVLFTDFVNFTKTSERLKPQELIDELHTCFKVFDEITGKYNIEKIKTIGDAYLAVCGLPVTDPKHAENVVKAAIEIVAFMDERIARLGNKTFEIRVGVHSGSVVAGIVGVKKFAYDIWGDTVNTAARMEQHGAPGKINISQTTYELIKNKFSCEHRGAIEAKNKGAMNMYFVHA